MVRTYTYRLALLVISTTLTACEAKVLVQYQQLPPEATSSATNVASDGDDENSDEGKGKSKDNKNKKDEEQDPAHADCSKYATAGKVWINRAFVTSSNSTHTEEIEITSDCKMRRSYCNQEFDIPSNLEPTLTKEQKITLKVDRNSFDGCFQQGELKCTLQIAYFFYYEGNDYIKNKTRPTLLLKCPDARVGSLSYVNERD